MAKVLCIEIGVSTTKIVEMDYQAKKPKVYHCFEVKTPEGAVKDGYLDAAKTPMLKDAIKNALIAKKIRTKRVIFTVFSGKIISREITVPGVKLSQISAVVEANVSEYFPIELDDYKISHFFINTIKEGENAGKHKVLVMAVEKALLDAYDRFATDLGLRIVDIDYAGNSVVQATKHSAGASAVMVVKMEDENAIITILQNATFVLQRNVNYALGRLSATPMSKDEELQALTNTMMHVADFYTSQDENHRIEQIYIMGEGSREQLVPETVTYMMKIPCRVLDTVRGVTVHKNAENVSMNLFAAVIGAGISSVGFATEKEKERHETNYVSACLLMFGFFVVLVIALLSLSLIPYNVAVMEEKALQKKKEEYAPALAVYNQHESIKTLYTHIEYGHLLTEHSNDSILAFLDELEKQMPADVEMTDFASDDEMCVMTMRVDDKETAAGVINKLRDFESVRYVTVESVLEETPETGMDVDINTTDTVVRFTVSCYYYIIDPVAPVAASTETAATATTTTEATTE